MIEKVKSQMKANFFDPKDFISIIAFLAEFMFACDTYSIHKGPAMWILPYFVKKTLENALKSRMCDTDK